MDYTTSMAYTPIDPWGTSAMSQTVINNRYEIIQTLGVGGMSAVFEAHDRVRNQSVALKVLRVGDSLQSEPSETKSKVETFFKREARALAKLNHDSIPKVFDYSDDNHDPAYISMERIDGLTLSNCLKPNTPLPIPLILSILLRISEALAHAHSHGLLHRDIKPENIMLTPKGRIVLVDFGLTRGITSDILGKTVSGGRSGIFGSLEFLSPEQIADEPVSLPSDVFSLGSLAYLLTTGDSAFKHRNPADLLRSILNTDFLPAETLRADIPGGLQKLIESCLVGSPDERTTAFAITQKLQSAMARWNTSPEEQVIQWLKQLNHNDSDLEKTSSPNMTDPGE